MQPDWWHVSYPPDHSQATVEGTRRIVTPEGETLRLRNAAKAAESLTGIAGVPQPSEAANGTPSSDQPRVGSLQLFEGVNSAGSRTDKILSFFLISAPTDSVLLVFLLVGD